MIIGLCGVKGSGKTTAAEYLGMSQLLHRVAFADPIKAALKVKFGLTDAQLYGDQKEIVDPLLGVTPRVAMQREGTEFGRDTYGGDIWIRVLKKRIDRRILAHPDITRGFAIEDVRFRNEADAIRSWGGIVIGLRRGLDDATDPHPSELEMREGLDDICDVVVDNRMFDLHTLYRTLDYVIEQVRSPRP